MNTYSQCHGCGLCTLVCPVWQQQGDRRYTPQGHAKALQYQGDLTAETVFSCTLCGACAPVCPQKIKLVDFMIELRQQATATGYGQDIVQALQRRLAEAQFSLQGSSHSGTLFLPGAKLVHHENRLHKVLALLQTQFKPIATVRDAGVVSAALEAGVVIPESILQRFLVPLREAQQLIVEDGILVSQLRNWLPDAKISSLALSLSSLRQIRAWLKPTDLYIIESRGYHSLYEQAVLSYNDLQNITGCQLNWDLQRLAIPTAKTHIPAMHHDTSPNTAQQIQWILDSGEHKRIVVEDIDDYELIHAYTDTPVVYFAELAQI